MKTVINWLQNLRPLKVLKVFLAVTFLVLVQACNRPGIAAQPSQTPGQPPNVQRYDPSAQEYNISPRQGGMNEFSDVDPRAKNAEKAANARAKDLIENAQKNVESKRIDSVDQYVRNYQEGAPLDERVKRLGQDVGSSAEELREGVTKGTQRGIENLQENIQNAAEYLTKNVQRGTEDLGKNIQRTSENATDAFRKNVREAN
ncbi:hypothetical protein [Dolichospermum sp. UHCC 0259]|uniref:hypothetical protein n=1 Tax=Dolichospermum sp. UHCC 0259 TaxID=2590010 RepID=UPI001447AD23|nr:hypothetical protein [Dolichospermum sp. UHCC 0259]MTJ46772.1 hypothetical protein [Dolichospermum sp. UHCC 0259]